jgi:predicted RNA binding protein YcfA (HicA-like mRNA interferase family)
MGRTTINAVNDWIEVAAARGWRVVRTNAGHLKFYAPDGETIVLVATKPGKSPKAMKNSRAELRRAGLDV